MHDSGDKIRSILNKFEGEYDAMVESLKAEPYDCKMLLSPHIRNYMNVLETDIAPHNVITADNIHLVKVLLIGEPFDYKEGKNKFKVWTFKIMHPHLLAMDLVRESAKIFFDEIKQKQNF